MDEYEYERNEVNEEYYVYDASISPLARFYDQRQQRIESSAKYTPLTTQTQSSTPIQTPTTSAISPVRTQTSATTEISSIPAQTRTISAIPSKSTKGSKEKDPEFVWHDDLTYYFINKWQTEPCLYHVSHEDYHVKDKRTLPLERIIESMSYREFFTLPTVHNLTDKMNSLRTYFNAQKNKHQASKSLGSGTNKIFKILRWQFYDCLSFLLDSTTPKETYSTLALDTDDQNNPPPPQKGKKTQTTSVPDHPFVHLGGGKSHMSLPSPARMCFHCRKKNFICDFFIIW